MSVVLRAKFRSPKGRLYRIAHKRSIRAGMHSLLATFSAICFSLCQQFCLISHCCHNFSSHEHRSAHDQQHPDPLHKNSSHGQGKATSASSCTIVKPTETFTLKLQQSAINFASVQALVDLMSPGVLIGLQISLLPTVHGPPIILSRLQSSLSVAPNAPPTWLN